MNVLIQELSRLGRYPLFLFALLMAVAMHFSGQLVWNAHGEYRAVLTRLDSARKERLFLDQQKEKIQDYKKFSSEVQDFVKAVQTNGMQESRWTSYTVDIKDRLMTVADMAILMSNVGSSSRYYFRPKRLVITATSAKEYLPLEMQKLDNTALTPGEKVVLSLSGTYLVVPEK
ncbi:MAG: hypothetical protein HQL93_06040 [Magnetococcales bacterium]|nr:hypothetical protein [Magnetococcales bacterium]